MSAIENRVPVTIKALEMLRDYQERAKQIGVAKTPEQRAREAAQRARHQVVRVKQRRERARRRIARKSARLTKLYEKWSRFDSWRLRDEAVSLLFGLAPPGLFGFTLLDEMPDEMEEVWEQARRAAGVSLEVVNSRIPDGRLRVKPDKFFAWAKLKGFAIPPEMDKVLNGGVRKLARANITKQAYIQERQDRLQEFVDKIEELRSRGELTWSQGAIAVAKKDLAEVFRLLYPDAPAFTLRVMTSDLKELGIIFATGIKAHPRNELKQLFTRGKFHK